MTNTVVTEKTQLEPEKLYRVSQVLPLFSGKSHNQVRKSFQSHPEVKRGRKADKPVSKSSRYFLSGADIQSMLK